MHDLSICCLYSILCSSPYLRPFFVLPCVACMQGGFLDQLTAVTNSSYYWTARPDEKSGVFFILRTSFGLCFFFTDYIFLVLINVSMIIHIKWLSKVDCCVCFVKNLPASVDSILLMSACKTPLTIDMIVKCILCRDIAINIIILDKGSQAITQKVVASMKGNIPL